MVECQWNGWRQEHFRINSVATEIGYFFFFFWNQPDSYISTMIQSCFIFVPWLKRISPDSKMRQRNANNVNRRRQGSRFVARWRRNMTGCPNTRPGMNTPKREGTPPKHPFPFQFYFTLIVFAISYIIYIYSIQ